MSVENVKAFMGKLEQDKALQKKLEAMVKKVHETIPAEVVKIASAAGFKFTAGDLTEARKAALGALSDEELKQAAGGGTPYWSRLLR